MARKHKGLKIGGRKGHMRKRGRRKGGRKHRK